MRKTFWLWLLLSALVLAEPVAVVVSVKGEVTLLGEKPRKLRAARRMTPGDQIKLGPGAQATIRFYKGKDFRATGPATLTVGAAKLEGKGTVKEVDPMAVDLEGSQVDSDKTGGVFMMMEQISLDAELLEPVVTAYGRFLTLPLPPGTDRWSLTVGGQNAPPVHDYPPFNRYRVPQLAPGEYAFQAQPLTESGQPVGTPLTGRVRIVPPEGFPSSPFNPRDQAGWVRAAAQAEQLGLHEMALEIYTWLLVLDPQNPEYVRNAMELSERTGRYVRSALLQSQLLHLEPPGK